MSKLKKKIKEIALKMYVLSSSFILSIGMLSGIKTNCQLSIITSSVLILYSRILPRTILHRHVL